LLTPNEFAALSLVYLIRYTVTYSAANFVTLCEYIQDNLIPFVPDLTDQQSSFWHLEAQSCATVEIGQISLTDIFRNSYGGLIGMGFDRQQLESHLPDGKKNALDAYIVPCLHNPEKLQPKAARKEVFQHVAKDSGLTVSEIDTVWGLFEGTMVSEDTLITMLKPHVPGVEQLFQMWNSTPLKSLKLNSLGIAIAHANAKRVIGFETPLDIWLK
jgi:hypothetical protein